MSSQAKAKTGGKDGHRGSVVESANGFDVVDCMDCGFKHIIPVPTEDELEHAYSHEYYAQDKPLYIERHTEDREWWDLTYAHRFGEFERLLAPDARRLLDIGSGPGYFLMHGKSRGWTVKGIEPSVQAAEHSVRLGLDIENAFFSSVTAEALGTFDVINMGEVLEHIPDPAALLRLIHRRLNPGGLVCIVVPNDFSPFQRVLRETLKFPAWWVAPPHHINYFSRDSLGRLLRRCGFTPEVEEVTFPIDLFLLMGDNYVGNDVLGRECHERRMRFEKAVTENGQGPLLGELYRALAQMGIGRDLVVYGRKASGANS